MIYPARAAVRPDRGKQVAKKGAISGLVGQRFRMGREDDGNGKQQHPVPWT